jgi:protein translocase SecG subunit
MPILQIVQIVTCVLMIAAILTQSKGVGLSATFGGSDFTSTRRGAEKVLFIITIVLAVLFVLSSILNLIYK